MTKWQKVKLGDVFEVARGGSPRPIDSYITCDEDGINWIKIGDTVENSKYITVTKQKIKKEGLKKSRYVQSGDFLLSNSMSFGRPYVLRTNGCIHDGWLVLRDKRNVYHKEFLYYVLSSPTMYRKFEQQAVGGVVNNLNSDIVRNVIIPLPPMEEQEKIAKELDSVAELLEKQKQLLAEQDTLIKSIFYDMFGDPLTENKEWKYVKIKDIASVVSGTTPKTSDNRNWNGEYPWITPAELSEETFIVYKTARTITKHGIVSSNLKSFPKGTVILSSRAPIGKTAIAGMDMYCNQGFKNLVCNLELVSPIFMYIFLKNNTLYLQSLGRGATFKEISKSIVEEIEFSLPPLSLQQKFAAIVEEIEAQKEKIKASITETQTLFNALMAKYFDEE